MRDKGTQDSEEADARAKEQHEAAELRAKLEKANQMIKTQNTAYQRAIRRAVLENDYVSKINNKLVQKVERQTWEHGCFDKDMVEVQNICGDMRQLITELVRSKNEAETKVQELISSVRNMKMDLSAKEEKVQKLATKVGTSEEQNQKLREDKETLKIEILSLRRQKEASESKEEDVLEAPAVGHKSTSTEDVSEVMLQLIAEKEELSEELKVMRESRDETKAELESLLKRFDAEGFPTSQIDQLERDKHDAEKKVQELMSKIEKMELDLSDKEKGFQELGSINARSKEQNKNLLADREAESPPKDLEVVEAKGAAHKAVDAALKEQLDQSFEGSAKIQQDLDALMIEKEEIDKAMVENLAEVKDENKRLTNFINSLLEELVLVKNDVMNDSTSQSDVGIDDADKSIETQVADNLSLISALRLKLRFYRKDNEDLQKSVSENVAKIALMENELKESLITAGDAGLAVSDSSAEFVEHSVKEEREKFDVSNDEPETEREKAELQRVRIVELENQVSKLRELETDLVTNNSQLREEVQMFQSELAKLTKDLEITVVKARERGDNADVHLNLEDVRRRMSDDIRAIADFRGQIKALEDQKRDVQDTLLSVTKDRDELEEKCESASEELRVLQDKLESAVGMGVEMTSKAEKYKEDITALTTKRDAAEQFAKDLHAENESNIAKCVQLGNTIASMQNERELLEKVSKAAIAKANDRLNTSMKDYVRQLTTLFPPLHPARKQNHLKFEDMISLLQKERNILLAKIKSLEDEIEAVQEESAILEQQVHILSKEVSRHKRQNKDILRALNEVTVRRSEDDSDIPMDEVAVDAEVEKRLEKFKQFLQGRLSE